jgi:hypothetical protein
MFWKSAQVATEAPLYNVVSKSTGWIIGQPKVSHKAAKVAKDANLRGGDFILVEA